MPYSQLVYRDLRPAHGPARATVVALHGNHGGLNDLIALASALGSDRRVVAPEAARGDYKMREVVGHSWYGGSQVDRPDPASFGDSLAQLERFLYDVRDRDDDVNPSLPWLLGYDQGAVLALTMSIIAPDLIGGVMAICGGLPTFSNPTLLDSVESDLPVLLIGDGSNRPSAEAMVDSTAARLAQLGNRVTVRWVEGAATLGDPVTHEVHNWFQDHRSQ